MLYRALSLLLLGSATAEIYHLTGHQTPDCTENPEVGEDRAIVFPGSCNVASEPSGDAFGATSFYFTINNDGSHDYVYYFGTASCDSDYSIPFSGGACDTCIAATAPAELGGNEVSAIVRCYDNANDAGVAGSNGCACTGGAGSDGTAWSEQIGDFCAPWDQITPASYCLEDGSSFGADWCSDDWCYVDPDACDTPTYASTYFPEVELYFSYLTCDADFSGNTWVGFEDVGYPEDDHADHDHGGDGDCAPTCSGYTCDWWADLEYSCSNSEDYYGCDCSGCDCREVTPCSDTCSGQSCDYWIASSLTAGGANCDGGACTCDFLFDYVGCNCFGCACSDGDCFGPECALQPSPSPSPSPEPGVANRPLDVVEESEEEMEVAATDDALAAFAALQDAQETEDEKALRVVIPVVGACAGLLTIALLALLILKLRRANVPVISNVNKVVPTPRDPPTPQPGSAA